MNFDRSRADQLAAYAEEFLSHKDELITGNIESDAEEKLNRLEKLMRATYAERMKSGPTLLENRGTIAGMHEKSPSLGIMLFAVLHSFEQLIDVIDQSVFRMAINIAMDDLNKYRAEGLPEDNNYLLATHAYLAGINHLIVGESH